jgi:hypothetical protein
MQNAATHTNRYTGAKRFRIRELRQTGWHTYASQAKEEKTTGQAEAEQAKRLAFSLSASLAFRPVSLLALSSKPLPRQATARDLRAHNSESFGVSQLTSIVTEGLFIEVAKQVERLDADICSVELPLHQRPEILHCVGVDVTIRVLHGVVDDLMPVIFGQAVIGLQRVSKQRRTRCNVLPDVRVKFMLAPGRNGKGANVAAALHHTESDSLICTASARNNTLAFWRGACCGLCHQ